MATNAIFKITNGTDTVDLLADAADLYGFHIESWKPAIAEYKGGGVWRDSPLAHGRRIAGKYFANVIETMTLAVHGYSADDVAARLSDLRQLLEQASDYWIAPYSNTPVWVIARAKGETNTRYALLYAGRITEDNNPYASPFLQPGDQATMVELPFTFERGHWASSEPGERECAAPLVPVRKSFIPTESGDDAFVITGSSTISITGTGIVFGNAGGTSLEHLGIRFKNISIPKEAKILSAHICFEAASSLSTTTVNARIYGEKTTVPAIFSTYADFVGRTLTTAYASWSSVSASTLNDDFNTPDLAQVIQEIVDQSAWISGKNLVLFIRDNGSSSGALRNMASYENVSAHEPILVVTWLDEGLACTEDDYSLQNIVTSKQNRAQLSGLYYYDASITTFSDNLLNGNPPYSLMPSTVASGDILYYIIDSFPPGSGPFTNVVHDLLDNSVNLDITWEIYIGSWSTSINLVDHTNDLSESGIRSTHWSNPAWTAFDMGTLGGTNNPGVTGFALRARVVTATATNPPRVQNTHPYTVTWPYVEIPSVGVPGDIPPLGDIEFRYRNQNGSYSHFVFGVRSVSRGNDFNAYLNASDEQHPFGLTCTAGTSTSFGDSIYTATGRSATCDFATAVSNTRLTWTFDDVLAAQYAGRFRVFLRLAIETAGVPDIDVRLDIDEGTNEFNLDWVSLKENSEVYDLGVLDLSNIMSGSIRLNSLAVKLRMRRNSGALSVEISDLVLIPVDECAVEIKEMNDDASAHLTSTNYIEVDSVTNPKSLLSALARTLTNGNQIGSYRAYSRTLNYQVNARQRLYFFADRVTISLDNETNWEYYEAMAVSVYKLSQYLGLRGRK